LIKQGDAARDRRDWREAARLYGLVIEASPSSLAIQVQLGHAHKELGDLDRAGMNYYAVLGQAPTDDDLHLQIGHLQKLKGNLQEAAAYYRKSVALNPRNINAVVEYHALAAKLHLPAYFRCVTCYMAGNPSATNNVIHASLQNYRQQGGGGGVTIVDSEIYGANGSCIWVDVTDTTIIGSQINGCNGHNVGAAGVEYHSGTQHHI
jgi:tetratricopeptide (TPR) repeat protein